MNATTIDSMPVPMVTDADIALVEGYLGVGFDDGRREILRSNGNFDVQACPGSGKTTLLVAKLAILGEHWSHPRRGLCVLSHTNVARQQIETKLARAAVGRRLLSYPHFVGTIHGFVNEFLALPLLRSEGYHVRLIDDESCVDWIKRRLLSGRTRRNLRSLTYHKRTLDAAIRGLVGAGEVTCAPTPVPVSEVQWSELLRAKREAVGIGLWYHADMFEWAKKLLRKHPEVAEFVRWRFPAVFLDETQDTSELQGNLLATIFPASGSGLRQRFGDSNQAIYDFGQRAATTDQFPALCHRSLPNSQRFGPGVASKAHSLAVDPPNPALTGDGPRQNVLPRVLDPAGMPHTIFLFAPHSVRHVLPAFGSLLLKTFPADVLRSDAFLARAVGRVGRSDAPDDKMPRHLGDYWQGYEPRARRLQPRPQHLADYVHIAQCRRVVTVDCAELVEMVAGGICELVGIVSPALIPRSGRRAQWLREVLGEDMESTATLNSLLWEWCVEAAPIAGERWTDKVVELRRALTPILGSKWNSDADAFCQWSTVSAGQTPAPPAQGPVAVNLYRFGQDGRYVDIDVGTIHSAKGQTHTATLVVESFFKRHDMEDLLPWICGDKCGADRRVGVERTERMRLIYTAVTRPSHLICLAMRRDALGKGVAEVETRKRLERLGWTVRDLSGASEELLDGRS